MANEMESVNSIVMMPVGKDAILDNFRRIQDLKSSLVESGDKIEISGKPYILKSGWRKLAFAFNLTDTIMKEDKELVDAGFVWRIQVRVVAPNGRTAMGIGACSSNERKFAHPEHDVYAMAHTRAKNRAISDILGLGEVSAEEMGSDVDTTERPVAKQVGPRDPDAKITSKQIGYVKGLAKDKYGETTYKVSLEEAIRSAIQRRKENGEVPMVEDLTMGEVNLVIDYLRK